MEIYEYGYEEIRGENVCINTKGMDLLFEARASCLRTKLYRSNYSQQVEAFVCFRKAPELTQHIVLNAMKFTQQKPVGIQSR